jgi:hypothetical protein
MQWHWRLSASRHGGRFQAMPLNVGFMLEKLEIKYFVSKSPVLPTVRTTPPQLNASSFIYHQSLAAVTVFDKLKSQTSHIFILFMALLLAHLCFVLLQVE